MAESAIQPKILFTQAYLDDPIQFAVDTRFDPMSALRLVSGLQIVSRDTAGFVVVEINTQTPTYYPIAFVVPVHERRSVKRVIDKTIKQLLSQQS